MKADMLHVSKLCMRDDPFEYFLLIFIYVVERGFTFAFARFAVGKFYCLTTLHTYLLKYLFSIVRKKYLYFKNWIFGIYILSKSVICHCTSLSRLDAYLYVVVSKKEHRTMYNIDLKYKKLYWILLFIKSKKNI